MTQNERVLKHIREHGSITAAEAVSKYGIYRLAARVSDLRKQGYNIVGKREAVLNRYEETCYIKRYHEEVSGNGD